MTADHTTAELSLGPIGNVFYFVDRLEEAVAWYAERLGRRPVLRGGALVAFDINGVRLTLHESDGYNSPGPAGVSAY
jgi:catechol 2,3-dioxygenase-like lactoylglutathione lyase family enzyme